MKLCRKNKKSGFTLLEIIVVIIILGILASLALPRLFKTVTFSRSAEALNTLGTIKRAMDRCAGMAGESIDYASCAGWNEISIDEADVDSDAWDYTITDSGANILITAALKSDSTADIITLTIATATGTATRSGIGNFASIRE